MKKTNSLKLLPKRLSMLPSPKPSAGVDAYEKEIELALKQSKLKKQNYDLLILYSPFLNLPFLKTSKVVKSTQSVYTHFFGSVVIADGNFLRPRSAVSGVI